TRAAAAAPGCAAPGGSRRALTASRRASAWSARSNSSTTWPRSCWSPRPPTTWLQGGGRQLRGRGVVFTVAGLGLAGLPPFGAFRGKGWIEAAGAAHGMPWITAVFIVCSVLVGAAVLRVAGGVFYGLGDPPSE